MLTNLVATDAMISTARDLLRIKAPRHYIETKLYEIVAKERGKQ